ncbi:MAG: hypothetical protein ACRC7W_01670 [Fusobacteriaceae bacterium]
MTDKNFLEGMGLISITTGKEVTEKQLEVYFKLLQDIPDEVFTNGIMKLLNERVYTNIPAPAEIRNYCNNKPSLELLGLKASETIRKMVKEGCRIGNTDFIVDDPIIVEVVRNLGGLKNLSRMNLETYEFMLSKKVPELYITLSEGFKGTESKVSIRNENMPNIEVREVNIRTGRAKLLLR